jgi:hypothetical protein
MLFDLLIFFLCLSEVVGRLAVIWEDMLTFIGPIVSFMPWFRLGHHFHNKQDDGKSFILRESYGMDRYRGKSHLHLFTGLRDSRPYIVGLGEI